MIRLRSICLSSKMQPSARNESHSRARYWCATCSLTPAESALDLASVAASVPLYMFTCHVSSVAGLGAHVSFVIVHPAFWFKPCQLNQKGDLGAHVSFVIVHPVFWFKPCQSSQKFAELRLQVFLTRSYPLCYGR